MKHFLFIFLCLFFIGCVSSNPPVSKLNSLTPGISRAELASFLDGQNPISTDFVNGNYLLKYELSDRRDIRGMRPYYFVFDQKDNLLGWEELKGQKKIIVGGVSILIPFPS